MPGLPCPLSLLRSVRFFGFFALIAEGSAVPAAAQDLSQAVAEDCQKSDESLALLSFMSVKKKLLVATGEGPASRLDAALPLAWLHVPKCGSSLENFLIHLPGLCPNVSDDLVISAETFGEHHNSAFKKEYRPLDEDGSCPGSFSTWGNHNGAGPTWDSVYQGHAVIMLRQPEQRLMSAYNYGYHSWPLKHRIPRDELDFAQHVQGCAVRMITRGGNKPAETCGGRDSGPPTEEEVQLAIHRIRTGFAFVGITDEWSLSMCLGHKKFGGDCVLSDFVDTRFTNGRKGAQGHSKVKVAPERLYDLSPLKGFKDPYDDRLYQAALEVFREEMMRYNVSAESCKACFQQAGVEPE